MTLVSERVVALGTQPCVESLYDNGYRAYRSQEFDTTVAPAVLIDNTGRMEPMTLTKSTMLVMVPIGALGAFQFDAMAATDKDGRTIFLQRPSLSRHEIFDLVQQIMTQNQSKIHVPGTGELLKMRRS